MPLRPVEFREAPLAWMIRELSQLSGPALGYAFILAVCVIWVGGSFLVESLEAAGLSPLLLTYICNSLFVARAVQLILVLILVLILALALILISLIPHGVENPRLHTRPLQASQPLHRRRISGRMM